MPGEEVGSIQINKHVVVCFHNKIGLFTEPGNPKLSENILVGEVMVSVQEISCNPKEYLYHGCPENTLILYS